MAGKLIAIASSLLWLTLLPAQAALYTFDDEDFKVESPFSVTSEIAYSGDHSLKIPVGEAPLKEDLPLPSLDIEGETIGVSFNYYMPEPVSGAVMRVVFLNAQGGVVSTQGYPLAPVKGGWERLEKIVAVPQEADISQASLRLTFPKLKNASTLFFDNIRMENLKQASDFQQKEFALGSFQEWKQTSFEQERLLFGPGGQLLMDWHQAKFGEACAELTGSGGHDLFQYPMSIRSLKVLPDTVYELTFFYNTSEAYAGNMALVLASFRDRDGRPIKSKGRQQLRLPKTTQWSEVRLDLMPPPEAESVDLSFRLVRAPSDVKVHVNNITFKQGSPKVLLKTEIDSEKRVLSGRLQTVMAPEGARTACTLKNLRGESVLAPVIDAEGAFSIDLSKLPDETFDVVATMSWEDGESRESQRFTNYNESSSENRLGIPAPSDAPPFPWKAVAYDTKQRRITTWNPTLTFSETGGLQQIALTTPAVNLLKSPLRLMVNGRDLFGETEAKGALESSASQQGATVQSTLAGEGFIAQVTARTEFDGMVKYTCRIEATRDLTLDAVDLQYEPEISDGVICDDGGWTHHLAVDFRKTGHLNLSRFYPAIWSGREDAGLYVAAERLYPALEEQEGECHQLNYEGVFTTRFVNRPLALKAGESHSITFAVGSTPFRPHTVDQPQWRFRAGKYSTGDLLWPNRELHPFFGFPKAPDDPSKLTRWLNGKGDKSVRKFNYQIPFFAMTNLPQYAYFEKAWHTEPAMIYTAENTRYDHDLLRVNISRKSWQDTYLQAFKTYFTEHPFDGVYYDCVSHYRMQQPDGGIAYQVFAVRDFFKRIYILQRQINPETWTFTHCGASVSSFKAAFSDIMLTGEHYRGLMSRHRYYLECITLEEFRIQNCTEFGPLRMFLPQFSGEKASAPDVTTHTLGMVLIHNLYLYPNFVHKEITNATRDRYYAFYDHGQENRFRPYWKEGAVDTGNPEVICSAHENSAGALRIYLNTSAASQKITLSRPSGSPVLTVYDPLHQQTVTLKDGDELMLEPYMMKMVLAADPTIWAE